MLQFSTFLATYSSSIDLSAVIKELHHTPLVTASRLNVFSYSLNSNSLLLCYSVIAALLFDASSLCCCAIQQHNLISMPLAIDCNTISFTNAFSNDSSRYLLGVALMFHYCCRLRDQYFDSALISIGC